MTPFLVKGTRTWKGRVYDRHGIGHIRSLGTRDEDEAAEIAAFLDWLREKRRWADLDLIIAGELPLAEAFDAHGAGVLAETIERKKAEITARDAEDADTDLAPLVTEWGGQGKRSRSDKYVKQVRRFIPEGDRFPKSRFTKKELKKFLDRLTVDPATKNRYRAALSQFARWLIQREELETNPLREVDGYAKPRAKPRFLEPHQVQALVWKLPEPFRALEATMAGTGMEWGAVEQLTRRDVDLERRVVYARGTKNQYRERYVEVAEDWAWQLVRVHVEKLAPEARVFEVKHETALAAHHDAALALKLPRTTLHQHRHSFAVMHIRRGTDHQWIKNQLGHAPHSTLLYTTYGVYIAEARLKAKVDAKAETRAAKPRRARGRK